jgi:hypothetical protein
VRRRRCPHVRAGVVVSSEPLRGVVLCLLDGFYDVLVKPFITDGAVVALDLGAPLALSGFDVLEGNAPFLRPYQRLATDVFRAVVDPYGTGFSALHSPSRDEPT